MPQISPMNWLHLALFFIAILFILMSKLFHSHTISRQNKPSKNKTSSSNLHNNLLIWTW